MQTAATRSSRYSLLTVAQLVVRVSGALLSALAAGLILYLNSRTISESAAFSIAYSADPFMIWSLAILGLLGIWSAFVAIRKLNGKQPSEAPDKLLQSSLILIPVWVTIAIAAGYLLDQKISLAFLTPLMILLVVIPLIITLALGIEKIQHGTVQHFWGLVTGSIFVTMPLTMLLEGVLLLIAVSLVSVKIASNPDLYTLFLSLSQADAASQAQLQHAYSQLTPLLSSPTVIYGLILGLCVLAPVVEELFKPLMIWAFAKRSLTPAQGFGMGLICGAAFAVLESALAMRMATSLSFVQLLLGRTGTSTLHIFCTGLMGWAIVSGWRDGNVLRTALTYTGVVLMHGLWNFFAFLMGYGALSISLPQTVESLAPASPWILALLFVLMVTILWVMKVRILAQTPPPLIQLPAENMNEGQA